MKNTVTLLWIDYQSRISSYTCLHVKLQLRAVIICQMVYQGNMVYEHMDGTHVLYS